MLNRFASIVLVAALVCTLAGPPAFASKPGNVVNEELRTKIIKLVADAKAGGKRRSPLGSA